jgi:tetratricopeptide (TPR) repeat protein
MSRASDNTSAWEWAGLALAALVLTALPVYYFAGGGAGQALPEPAAKAQFVGSENCRDCHVPEYDLWEGSHHDLAMDIANEKTVLGDFDNAEITSHGVTSRFYRKDDRFFVYTNGPGGEMGDFEITHTFGWFPLQQYLVPFPGGRLQTLPLAWDSRDNQWFRVPPDEDLDPDDWLYWTNAAQNWNGMCAQCHSTNLEKNYDPVSDSYNTTWSDIDVGCEACHGPGSRHVDWAEMPDMARPQTADFELARSTSNLDAREHVEICAPCHSRRGALSDIDHTETDLMDSFRPATLDEGLYFADGQILDEVYVYGSFTQSKMYRHDVRCSDCHNVHSIERVKEGNELCLQCHRAADYDSYEHHFHKREGETGEPILSANGDILFDVGSGAQCVECHMPGRYYMGNDYRPDHSFRVPDPALNAAIDSPDACLRCHVDEDSSWSQEKVVEWYGPGQSSHYGAVLAAGREGDPAAQEDLIQLAADVLYPVIVRATALSLLDNYPGPRSNQALELALMDEESLIRHVAVQTLQLPETAAAARLLAGMLHDPVKGVRIEAANHLAGPLTRYLRPEQKELYDQVLKEYEEAVLYSADFPASRFNLGNLYNALERTDDAIEQYRASIRIDGQFHPAKYNLALLYNSLGQNAEAEQLLRSILDDNPQLYDIAYTFALLLVEMGKTQDALAYLEDASAGLPGRARIHYNLGLLYQQQQNMIGAEQKLSEALALEPGNLEFQYALADYYLKRGLFEEARPIAEAMMNMHPENPIGSQILNYIRQNTGR